ncbi:MAG: hypothetical protein N3H31_03325 [Candidatus Nezhaarchaeota archaeon]|nr:hypothetical protein [Candidatus Nezhaarchaeota archaeon]
MGMGSKYGVEPALSKKGIGSMERYGGRTLHEVKADAHGRCVKLLTDTKYVKER